MHGDDQASAIPHFGARECKHANDRLGKFSEGNTGPDSWLLARIADCAQAGANGAKAFSVQPGSHAAPLRRKRSLTVQVRMILINLRVKVFPC